MIYPYALSIGCYLCFRLFRICPLTGQAQGIDDAVELSPAELDRAIKDLRAFIALAEAEGKTVTEVKLEPGTG